LSNYLANRRKRRAQKYLEKHRDRQYRPESRSGAEVAQRIDMSFATVVDRVRVDFVERPEMELSLPQAVRLWSLGTDDCRFVIDALVDAGFLAWTPKRTIVRKGRDPLSQQETKTTDISVPVTKRYNKSV
jgi:hypothetical protein